MKTIQKHNQESDLTRLRTTLTNVKVCISTLELETKSEVIRLAVKSYGFSLI